ncbi:MAG: hypothetical protein EBR02_05395 [Alphaproteobacteria bacterium]|nr:hypothetical protein [Alphaproteobacteria bacterium]
MLQLLDRTTIFVMLSAFLVPLACVLPEMRGMFPFWIIASGLNIGDTLFSWLFGIAAIVGSFVLAVLLNDAFYDAPSSIAD